MSQDDIELKDLIIEKLTASGMLNDLKARIRAAVLHTLSQGKETKLPTVEQRKLIDSAVHSSEGKLAFSLMKDFMEILNLKNTISVFQIETGLDDSELNNREYIVDEYKHVITDNKPEEPLIYSFIKKAFSSSISNEKEIICGSSKNNSGSPKSKRILPQLSDPIEYRSEDTSEFSDAINLLDTPLQKIIEPSKPVISPYQAPQKRTNTGSTNEEHYDDSFSDKSSMTKHNQSDIEESINEVDVEEIDFKSEDRSGDVTVDSERSISLDYIEIAKPKH